jgi:Domain of Unknown Function (DUF1080)
MNRRNVLRLACAAGLSRYLNAETLFDGKTLDGWIQVENNATSLSSGSILDPAGFVHKITAGSDAMSVFLRSKMDDSLKTDLAAYSPSAANAKAVISALVKYVNQVIAGSPLPSSSRSTLRPVERLNKVLLEDAYPAEIEKSPTTGWAVKDGAMASLGTGRGVIYTAKDYSRYRLAFTMRHVSGNPDHQACVLIFCTRPQSDEKPLDALGGIQFQPPNGGRWDYRPGKNNNGGDEFTQVVKGQFNVHEWSRIEILADASKGEASMTAAQPPGSPPIEILRFHDPSAGRVGPVALQMHNAGLFDEYKDLTIEAAP